MKPHYEDGKFKFYVSETLMPRWYSESKDIDPSLKLQYAVRIPTADKQSSVVIEWVGQLSPVQGNAIIVPKEVIALSGSDFDIDKLFTQRFEGYFKDGKFVKYENNFDDFLDYMFKTKTQVNFKLNKLKEENKEYNKVINELAVIKNRVTIDTFKKKEAQDSINNLNIALKQIKSNGEQIIADINQKLKYPDIDQVRRTELINTRRVNKVFNDNINDLLINGYDIKDKLTGYNDIEDFDLLDEITVLLNKRNKIVDNLEIEGLPIEGLFKENVEKQKAYINSLSGLMLFNPQLKELVKQKKELDLELKKEVLNNLGYPTNQVEYSKENQTYSGVLNNEQLQRSIELLSQEEILDVYLTPSSIDPFKQAFNNFSYTLTSGKQYDELSQKLQEKTNEFYIEKNGDTLTVFPFALPTKDGKGNLVSKFLLDSDQYQQFTINNFVKYQNDVKAGKESIGLVANANVLGIYAKRYRIYLNTPIEFEGEDLSTIEFKTLKDKRVFDAIASTISVVVDEAKESQLANHGISVEDLKVMSVLMLHGLDVEDAIAFVQSPGAVQYKQIINRSKIKLETVYKTNEELINNHITEKNKDFKFDDQNIQREELVKYSATYDINLESKYIRLYERYTKMYNELAETIPIVKIKSGLPTTVEDVEKYQEQVLAITEEAEKPFNKKTKYYNFDNFVKQDQVKKTIDIIDTVNQVGRTELLEMKGVFSTIKKELENTSTITSNKSDYSRKINELIDKFLLGQKVQAKKPELLERADTIEQELIDTIRDFSVRLQDLKGDELKSSKDTLALVNRLVKVNDKNNIIFAIDGKLSSRLQMQIANAWLNLKHSKPGSKESKFADDLFDYYFLKSGLHWNPGSLEPMFPASQYKEYSDMYEELLTDNTTGLKNKFYEYLFSTPEGTKYLKAVNSPTQANEVSFDKKIGKYVADGPTAPIAIEVKATESNGYNGGILIKVNDVYEPLKQTKITFVNPMLYNKEVEGNQFPEIPIDGKSTLSEVYTPENITELKPNQVFVFGSNAEGNHGKGAALQAKQKFGAKQGQAEGLQGQSYAIITKKDWRVEKSSTLPEIGKGIQDMLLYAKANPELEFLVTKIGSSLAGYNTTEIKELFEKLKNFIPDNVVLPQEFEVRFGIETKQVTSVEQPVQEIVATVDTNILVNKVGDEITKTLQARYKLVNLKGIITNIEKTEKGYNVTLKYKTYNGSKLEQVIIENGKIIKTISKSPLKQGEFIESEKSTYNFNFEEIKIDDNKDESQEDSCVAPF